MDNVVDLVIFVLQLTLQLVFAALDLAFDLILSRDVNARQLCFRRYYLVFPRKICALRLCSLLFCPVSGSIYPGIPFRLGRLRFYFRFCR